MCAGGVAAALVLLLVQQQEQPGSARTTCAGQGACQRVFSYGPPSAGLLALVLGAAAARRRRLAEQKVQRETLARKAAREAHKSSLRLVPSSTETLIFVDIDGVLNVGVRDGQHHPLTLSKANMDKLARLQSLAVARDPQGTAEKLKSACVYRPPGEEDKTYAELCKNALEVADIFVKRLARIIEVSGSPTSVVLTSTWRLPNHVARLRVLEKAMSHHLGKSFTFTAKTAFGEVASPEGRLDSIGKFLAEHCERSAGCRRLRVLVLEDFHVHPLGTWTCEGLPMTSASDVEAFLRSRARGGAGVTAKLVHTYDEWVTQSGMTMQVGSGLTMRHYRTALEFLREGLGTPASRFLGRDLTCVVEWQRSVSMPSRTSSGIDFADGCSSDDELLNSAGSPTHGRQSSSSAVVVPLIP